MASESNDLFLYFNEHTALKQMQLVIEEVYPMLFSHLSHMRSFLEPCIQDEAILSVETLLEKILAELDAMMRQEKYLLFPFLEKLNRELKKSDSCAPFNQVKNHYKTSLRLCAELKSSTTHSVEREQHTSEILKSINEGVNDYMEMLIKNQEAKEVFLYKPFKSCSGCKKIA